MCSRTCVFSVFLGTKLSCSIWQTTGYRNIENWQFLGPILIRMLSSHLRLGLKNIYTKIIYTYFLSPTLVRVTIIYLPQWFWGILEYCWLKQGRWNFDFEEGRWVNTVEVTWRHGRTLTFLVTGDTEALGIISGCPVPALTSPVCALCFTSSRHPSGRCRLYDNFSAHSSWNIRILCTHTWHYWASLTSISRLLNHMSFCNLFYENPLGFYSLQITAFWESDLR